MPEYTWGGLHIWETPLQRVRDAVTSAYQAAGLASPKHRPRAGTIPKLRLNDSGTLGDDELLVLAEPDSKWIAVLSRACEWTPRGKNPLPKAISRDFDVMALNSVADSYSELAFYRRGKLKRSADLAELATRNSIAEGDLKAALHDPDALLTHLGMSFKSYRDAFEAAPLEDYPKDAYLVFRSPNSRSH